MNTADTKTTDLAEFDAAEKAERDHLMAQFDCSDLLDAWYGRPATRDGYLGLENAPYGERQLRAMAEVLQAKLAERDAEIAGLKAELADAEAAVQQVRDWATQEVQNALAQDNESEFSQGFGEAQDLCAVAVLDILSQADEVVEASAHPSAAL